MIFFCLQTYDTFKNLGGYWTYVKVRPYRQGSIVKKLHQKLVVCYYRPFPVVKQMGPVAFQLQLHVCPFKKPIGQHPVEQTLPTQL